MVQVTLIQKPRRDSRGQVMVKVGDHYSIVEETREHGQHLTVKDVKCSSRKDAYPTYEAALKAYHMKSTNGQRTKRIYKCHECGYWHFTSNTGFERRPRPYDRSLEKRRARMATREYDGYESVDANPLSPSTHRFRNYLSRCNAPVI